MTREDLRRLFAEAHRLCGESDYVVIGSLAALGYAGTLPDRMTASIDVDAWCRSDPARVFDLAEALGQGSAFEAAHGYYLDPVSPRLATLPDRWEERLVRIGLDTSIAAWFLEPNDAAVSKYARMEPRDREWIRAGLEGAVLSLPTIAARFATTTFLDGVESARAHKAIDDDQLWWRKRRTGGRRPRRDS